MKRAAALLAMALALAGGTAAQAEKLTVALSTPSIQINSNFTGTNVTIFGVIERDAGTVARAAPYQVAQVQALRRDPDAMFLWLEKARTSKDGALENLLIDPIILRYRSDPRLAAFCARIGLPSPLHSQTRGI